jgi:hypothetical protein
MSAIPCAALLFTLAHGASAQSLANQSVEDRLNTLMRVVEMQQHKIDALENQVIELEMSRRGRGEPGYAAAAAMSPEQADIQADAQASAQPDAPPSSDDAPTIHPQTPIGRRATAALAQNSPSGVPPATTGTATGVPAVPNAPGTAGTSRIEGAATPTVGQQQKSAEPARTQAEEAVVQREHAPLFDHKLTIDWGISDTYYDRRQLQLSGFLALDAIFLGNINLGQTKSHQIMADADIRYGLTDRISVDVDIPYMYRTSSFFIGGAGGAASSVTDTSVNSHNIGDVTAGIYYQLVKESGNWPDIVGSLRVKSNTGTSPFGIKLIQPEANNNNLQAPTRLPTGTGFWNVTAGLSFLKTYDPVVLFGSLSYTYSIARSFADISSVVGQTQPAKVKLGDIVQAGAGVAIAFSEKDSASVSYTLAIEPETKTETPGQGWSKVPGSQTTAGALNFGLNHVVNKHLTINGSVSLGLTPDAPNFVVGVRFPYTF